MPLARSTRFAAVTLLASEDDSWCVSAVQHEERVAYLIGIIARLAETAVQVVTRAQVALADAAPVPREEKW